MNTLTPIPGYENYRISLEGNVYNDRGHLIKPVRTFYGDVVELRKFGQRERLYVCDILSRIKRQEMNNANSTYVQDSTQDDKERT